MKFNIPWEKTSMTYTSAVISNVATNTMTVDCCNSDQVGQVTFSAISLYDSLK
jgi:hypothetical protein